MEDEGFRARIGANIAFAREKAGLKQQALADRLKGSPGGRVATVSDWERGERTPDAISLLKLANALNVSADWLLTGEGEMNAPVAAQGKGVAGRIGSAAEVLGEISSLVDRYRAGEGSKVPVPSKEPLTLEEAMAEANARVRPERDRAAGDLPNPSASGGPRT